jgi:hypothetical protein
VAWPQGYQRARRSWSLAEGRITNVPLRGIGVLARVLGDCLDRRISGGARIVDELEALQQSRLWIERRVDKVEFLDLTTVRRTIALTVDLAVLKRISPRSGEVIPLGWFAPWANAEAHLLDANGMILPYLTSELSDRRVTKMIDERLRALELDSLVATLGRIPAHRANPGLPGAGCRCCGEIDDKEYVELMSDKWGCRALLEPLKLICARRNNDKLREKADALAQIMLAWQTNFVLFADLSSSAVEGVRRIIELSYDEELKPWERPWERRRRVLGSSCLTWTQDRRCRQHISRGGPFVRDLDALMPGGLRGAMSMSRWWRARHMGQRGLGVAWHVAWHQASGLDVRHQQVDVILPAELTAVRMRMLRTRHGDRTATLADQVGARATIVAPEASNEDSPGWSPPTLFSLVITQRSPSVWRGGFWLAALTSLAILTGASFWLPAIIRDASTAATILVVAPTLVASLLSFRAASEIAEQLTLTLRTLLAGVGVLAALCAAALVVGHVIRGTHGVIHDIDTVRAVWILSGGIQLAIAYTLWTGGRRISRLIAWGQRASSRNIEKPCPG